jgi:hypothetical protein
MWHKFFTKNKCLGSIVFILFCIARILKTKSEVKGGWGNARGIGGPDGIKQIGRVLLDR